MGPERLSKIMTCGKYFEDFRSTFTEQNSSSRHRTINRVQTSEEKEFGKLFHNLIQCYVANKEVTHLSEYLKELVSSQSNERWTSRLVELLSPHYDGVKTTDSFLSSGDTKNMERYLKRFSMLFEKYRLEQFDWTPEMKISGFPFDRFLLNGDIDLIGINEAAKRIFLIELKKAQITQQQWIYQLYLYMLMAENKYKGYQIYGTVWHPSGNLKAENMDAVRDLIESTMNNSETNAVRFICADCKVWNCDDRK